MVVEMEGHGWEEIFGEVDLTRTVGWFTSVYPVRLELESGEEEEAWEGGRALGKVVKRVKRSSCEGSAAGGMGYGMLRYLNGETGRELKEVGEAGDWF